MALNRSSCVIHLAMNRLESQLGHTVLRIEHCLIGTVQWTLFNKQLSSKKKLRPLAGNRCSFRANFEEGMKIVNQQFGNHRHSGSFKLGRHSFSHYRHFSLSNSWGWSKINPNRQNHQSRCRLSVMPFAFKRLVCISEFRNRFFLDWVCFWGTVWLYGEMRSFGVNFHLYGCYTEKLRNKIGALSGPLRRARSTEPLYKEANFANKET